MIILRLPTLSVQKSCRILQPSFLLFWSWSDCVCKINIEEDWKVEFERIIKTEKRENLFYLIKLLNQSGINLSKDVFEYPNKPDLIRKFNDMNELLEYAMEQLKGIDVKTYADNLEDRSKSIFSDIIDMCRRNNYASDNFRRIESAYRIVTQSSGVRKEAKQIQYNELVEHIKKAKSQHGKVLINVKGCDIKTAN